jgi:hypothetical protein
MPDARMASSISGQILTWMRLYSSSASGRKCKVCPKRIMSFSFIPGIARKLKKL